MLRVGVIEIGSRAIRLLVADVDPKTRAVEKVDSDTKTVLLKRAVDASGADLPKILAASNDIVTQFRERANSRGASDVQAFGTQALRKAADSGIDLRDYFSTPIMILDAQLEARSSLYAATIGLPAVFEGYAGEATIVDQGTGSTEVAFGTINAKRIDLAGWHSSSGTETISQLIKTDRQRLNEACRELAEQEGATRLLRKHSGGVLVALGSPATKLAFLIATGGSGQRYSSERSHGREIKLKDIDEFIPWALTNELEARKLIDPKDPSGPDYELVVSGIAMLRVLMTVSNVSRTTVSSWGTRYGLAFLMVDLAVTGSGRVPRAEEIKRTLG